MDGSSKSNTKNEEGNDSEKNNKEENKIDVGGFQFFANTCEEKLKQFLENYFSAKSNADLIFKAENGVVGISTGESDETSGEVDGKEGHANCSSNAYAANDHAANDSSNENEDKQENYFEKKPPIKSNYDRMAINLVDEVQKFIKPYVNERHKIIVQGIIGENKKQGIHVASKSLWNVETDNYISAKYVNDFIFVTVMVFLLYNE
ncbi:dynein light chain type 2, putative [Plasmodium knowlesi strain H]|uniref:Dynein light chain type 2, putative n=3 Tax=Plasmodium knowlesi TaxID=5850 RepID=A0A5K1UFV6_PLAKH|nr:dynein light chain Tctex-type, putative [Plasmodium knowlesi strain H]OTN65149.1 putative Dynein light chain type 2 [Plasmodium knowlesi]CAA9988163.1 dynein light chain Tctex-type, putative [Plasmodium knowlesi strain H]SBO20068.1 dynein light chain type 2, putative [Plasmodium knowlesi strain H]SBO20752.1 dynein light chain type 2, putative [Plasmodium knowlesi strain H]VVS77637.1 dynein light chain Tctex-type, putative [Plasmodium knowlesi strain H]|eukprot:XP_002259139.1 dynein light chain type 2, putative [Plasmodium knowlesi strain H]